jgi:hypothetical protein
MKLWTSAGRPAWQPGLCAAAIAAPARAASETTVERRLDADSEPPRWATHHRNRGPKGTPIVEDGRGYIDEASLELHERAG